MTISLAFLALNLVKAAVEGRLPRGTSIERLRDPPTEWGRQFEALGLKPEYLPRSQRSRITATQKADLRGLGNGIFGCGDRAPKTAAKAGERPQRPKSEK